MNPIAKLRLEDAAIQAANALKYLVIGLLIFVIGVIHFGEPLANIAMLIGALTLPASDRALRRAVCCWGEYMWWKDREIEPTIT